jgi:UDP-glucose:(heptosyl)LPS alpha-1,3-glucosyltransferase
VSRQGGRAVMILRTVAAPLPPRRDFLMQIAFCLYKYFPFGGLQRDFLRIALACQARGHSIRAYTLEWRGDVPAGFEVVLVPVRALSNPRRYAKFSHWVGRIWRRDPPTGSSASTRCLDLMSILPPTPVSKTRRARYAVRSIGCRGATAISRHTSALFSGPEARTEILLISPLQKPLFQKYYATPDERFHLLPPGIARDRRAPANAAAIRAAFRHEFALAADDLLCCSLARASRPRAWTAA